jgi:hypothetical protein
MLDISKAKTVLEQAIERRRASAAQTVLHVQENVPQDALVPTSLVGFHPDPEHGTVLLDRVIDETTRNPMGPLTRHALQQACGRVGFPSGYAADVMAERGPVGAAVVAEALSRLWKADAVAGKRVLTRSVNGRVHAVLSDKYRRIDCRPIVEAFCSAVAAEGAVPYEGLVTNTRISIKALLPEVFVVGRPGGWQDVVALGAGLTNSDFGAAANSAYAFLLRVMCVNGMTGEKVYSQRHLGGTIGEDDFYSQRTYKLDAATQTSASRDIVKALLGMEGRQRTLAAIERAATTNLDLDDEIGSLKKALTKGELAQVTAALQSVNEEEMPLGPPSPYRMANALAWAAEKAEDGDRKMELQKIAGGYVALGKAA